MYVVAQWVRASWTKQSRGGQQAVRRNRLPVAFALPESGAPCTHEVTMHEADGFQPQADLRAGPPSRDVVRLDLADGMLRVDLVPSSWGMPRRHRRPPAVRLAPGEWTRWHINYRFTGHRSGNWHYRLDTLNIAHGPVPVDIFLTEPRRVVDERAHLR
ncbi:hypothetical protein [Micromonospora sp. NPDC005173]|uniref:hypothetical protein n=1 Tax=Micromonospora sp. NPDC005173 TaxID=3157165 RepID=UPI0033BEF2B9